jgi:hypothetical protein
VLEIEQGIETPVQVIRQVGDLAPQVAGRVPLYA